MDRKAMMTPSNAEAIIAFLFYSAENYACGEITAHGVPEVASARKGFHDKNEMKSY
jgi:hypothetical protein